MPVEVQDVAQAIVQALQNIDGARSDPRRMRSSPPPINPNVYGQWQGGEWATAVDTRTDPYLHGPGGLFGVLGLEQDVISTRIVPRGLAGRLPVFMTDTQWPLYPYFMGVTASDEVDDAAGTCDDPPGVGNATTCRQTAQFGRYAYETDPIDLTQVARRINRGEFMDLRLVNDPVGDPLLAPITPDSSEPGLAEYINNEFVHGMVNVGIAYQNKLVRQVYTGNPANNNTGGQYREFAGLDTLISAGKRDAINQARCPGLDSLLISFNNTDVTANAGNDIITRVIWMYRILKDRAEGQRLNPVRFAITMRKALFWELTAIWPCAMATFRCAHNATADSVIETVSVDRQLEDQREMRNGFFLWIDGDRVPVIIDDGIVETDLGSGCYSSTMYFVPLTYLGNRAATYWEFFDYRPAVRMAGQAGLGDDFWTDGGRFLWTHKTNKLYCIQHVSIVEPRIILRTPQLAGKIFSVKYCPFMHESSALPGDVGYYDTGVTANATPTYYDSWGQVS